MPRHASCRTLGAGNTSSQTLVRGEERIYPCCHKKLLMYKNISLGSFDYLHVLFPCSKLSYSVTVRHSLVLLRPKTQDSTANTKCRKLDLYGEMGFWNVRDFKSQKQWEGPRRPDLPTLGRELPQSQVELKGITNKASQGATKKINTVSIFLFSRKWLYWIRPRTPSFCSGQSSLAPPILIRWWQTMARWNRDTKGSLFFCHLAVFWGGIQK